VFVNRRLCAAQPKGWTPNSVCDAFLNGKQGERRPQPKTSLVLLIWSAKPPDFASGSPEVRGAKLCPETGYEGESFVAKD